MPLLLNAKSKSDSQKKPLPENLQFPMALKPDSPKKMLENISRALKQRAACHHCATAQGSILNSGNNARGQLDPGTTVAARFRSLIE